MIVSEISIQQLHAQLSGAGVTLRVGPFVVLIQSDIDSVVRGIHQLYGNHPVVEGEFADFRLALFPSAGVRRWLKPQVVFSFDALQPFVPLPLNHAFPMFEWALNWCVAKHAHQYLIIHAAVVEKNGRAVIMPGFPGAGKSTLCAALVARGWRLLTDELALISLVDGKVIPIPRPVSLKNESITIIRDYAPEAVFGELFLDTKKGTVAHMKPPLESVMAASEPVSPGWIVMPRYTPRSHTTMMPAAKAVFCLHLANNSFNYNVLHEQGFRAVTGLVESCGCYDFRYSDLDSAMAAFAALAEGRDAN